jgi:hypothetical protein
MIPAFIRRLGHVCHAFLILIAFGLLILFGALHERQFPFPGARRIQQHGCVLFAFSSSCHRVGSTPGTPVRGRQRRLEPVVQHSVHLHCFQATDHRDPF